MRCPSCKCAALVPAKYEGFCYCPDCRFLYRNKVKDDPNLDLYVYKHELIKSKDGEPKIVFDKAERKFNNGVYEVVGLYLVKGKFSMLFGQTFDVLLRKKK